MSSENDMTFDNFQEGIFTVLGGMEKGKMMKYVIGGVLVLIAIIIVVFILYKMSSGFGNGRVVGSGCGRYNQLQRAINMEFPLAQTEYENAEMAKQNAAGIQYANHWQPPMENVYAGFQDRKTTMEVEQYQTLPTYPQTGVTQSVYNDNVFKNIAYE